MTTVGFEPTVSVFGRAKTVHGLAHSTTVIGVNEIYPVEILVSAGLGYP
jgi:hypothetical protein